jgi:hypothetical protein
MALGLLSSAATEWHETFGSDPATRGWSIRGDSSLFAWDAARGHLAATWDSSRTNTYFYRPLGTVLSRSDPFRFAFRIQLDEIRTAAESGTFQLAVGFLRRDRAFQGNFLRGSGVHPTTGPRDLVEFNYFPGAGAISPTFAAVAIGTNNLRWTTLHVFPVELTTGRPYDVSVAFDPVDQSLQLRASRDLEIVAAESVPLHAGFSDFRVDAFSVTSFSGAGQPANYAGSLLARGWVDDIVVTFPEPPRPALQSAGRGTVKLPNHAAANGWIPFLERAKGDAPRSWETIPSTLRMEGSQWILEDSHPPADQGLYQVRLERP